MSFFVLQCALFSFLCVNSMYSRSPQLDGIITNRGAAEIREFTQRNTQLVLTNTNSFYVFSEN